MPNTHAINDIRPMSATSQRQSFSPLALIIVAILTRTTLAIATANAQQVADTSFHPYIDTPSYPVGIGPVVLMDEAHSNFHTMDGRYAPLAKLLQRDGYVVRPSQARFHRDSLRHCHILVISNARVSGEHPLGSAFSPEEIVEVRIWVEQGGSLLLITDHMPNPSAAAELAAAFGAKLNNGFTFDSRKRGNGGYIFRRSDSSLRDHPIVAGIDPSKSVDSVYTGIGSAFEAVDFEPLLVFGSTFTSRLPLVPWEFTEHTPTIPIEGWFQGATRTLEAGRVAIFGEAGFFTAQLMGAELTPMGMNEPYSKQNPQFILNLFSWLASKL